MFIEVDAGHPLVVELLLETGAFNLDLCMHLKAPGKIFATPMFVAIGLSSLQSPRC